MSRLMLIFPVGIFVFFVGNFVFMVWSEILFTFLATLWFVIREYFIDFHVKVNFVMQYYFV